MERFIESKVDGLLSGFDSQLLMVNLVGGGFLCLVGLGLLFTKKEKLKLVGTGFLVVGLAAVALRLV